MTTVNIGRICKLCSIFSSYILYAGVFFIFYDAYTKLSEATGDNMKNEYDYVRCSSLGYFNN